VVDLRESRREFGHACFRARVRLEHAPQQAGTGQSLSDDESNRCRSQLRGLRCAVIEPDKAAECNHPIGRDDSRLAGMAVFLRAQGR
jgi:hypothetical protein